jgi:hypothetical protein
VKERRNPYDDQKSGKKDVHDLQMQKFLLNFVHQKTESPALNAGLFFFSLEEHMRRALRRLPAERHPFLEILNELRDLHAEIDALDAVHALICVLFLKMRGQRLASPFERDDICVFSFIEIETDRKIMRPDLGIHFHDLIF